jgi:hypothetical protein
MAVKTWSKVDHNFDHEAALYKCTGITENDTIEPLILPAHTDKTVRVAGTFGGATLTIKGGMLPTDGASDYLTCKDPADNNLAYTAVGMDAIQENVYSLVPTVSGGSGASLTVVVLAVKKGS